MNQVTLLPQRGQNVKVVGYSESSSLAKDIEHGKVVRARFLPRQRKRDMHQLEHHVKHKAKPMPEQPVVTDFVLHNLTYVFDGVRN